MAKTIGSLAHEGKAQKANSKIQYTGNQHMEVSITLNITMQYDTDHNTCTTYHFVGTDTTCV